MMRDHMTLNKNVEHTLYSHRTGENKKWEKKIARLTIIKKKEKETKESL